MFCLGIFASDVHGLAQPSVGVWTSGDTMRVTTAVDPMATDAGLPLRQHDDVVMTDEVEDGEANRQQQNPGHLATLTNGRAETYDDRLGKATVNGISKPSKAETTTTPGGDLIVANGNSNHSTPKKLQAKTDSAANQSPRYLPIVR